MKHFCLLLLSVLSATAAFSQFKEIKDPAEGIDLETLGSMGKGEGQDNWVIYKDKIYFIAGSGITGTSIYKTDGTSEGTTLAMGPSDESIIVTGLAVAGDNLFFLANNRSISIGGELYLHVSDGTQASVKQLGNMEVYGPHVGNAGSWKGVLYFTARDADHGYELWRSDGTEEGTFMLKDIYAGSDYSAPLEQPFNFYATDNYLFFTARDADHDIELWRTDGTGAGTIRLTNLPSGSSIQSSPASNSSAFYFVTFDGTGYTLRSSDGTVEGTSILKGDAGAILTMCTWNDKILYTTLDDELFVIDETDVPTKIGATPAPGLVKSGAEFKGLFYFFVGSELWKTDGTEQGTEKANAITNGAYNGIGANSNFIVMMSNTSTANQLWAYDGTTADLTPISEEFVWDVKPPAARIGALDPYHDVFFLPYNDGRHGVEPWVSDGTAEGTFMLKDIEGQPVMGQNIGSLTPVGSKVFFTANDGIHGSEPWVSDGTHDGTMLIRDMNPGTDGSAQNLLHGNFAVVNGIAIFATSPTTAGPRVWRSDGTADGTYSISDGNVGASILSESITADGFLYYDDGFALWKTDGTAEGTSKLKDLEVPGILNFGVLKETTVLFTVGKTLWKSDGTETGTVKIKELPILPGSFSQSAQQMFSFGDITLFVADNGLNGLEIWKTDGTSEGTQALKTIPLRAVVPYFYGEINGSVIFDFYSASGSVLWKTDGTVEGTSLVKELGENTNVQMPVGIDGTNLYLIVKQNDEQTMWQTDGTPAGTKIMFDLPEGFYANYWYPAASFNDGFFFPADSPDAGWELWRTTLTQSGTRVIGDLVQGPAGSFPDNVVATPDNLFFVARDESGRTKLWILDPDFVFLKDQTIDFETIEDKNVDDPPFELIATASSGLPLTFEVTSGPATISGSTLTITDAGDITVKASQEGNDEYYSAFVEQTFTVEIIDGLEDVTANISIWPNPATSALLIASSSDLRSATLHDMLGRDVLTTNIGQKETSINVSNLPRGMYLLKLRSTTDKIIVRKVILK